MRPPPRPRPVPLLLVRLKLRLWANSFRRDPKRRVGMVVSWAFTAGFGFLAVVVMPVAVDAATAAEARAIAVLGATALALIWAVGPLVAFGTDETLDPARLVLLPIPRRQLVGGLLAASFVGAAPAVATLAVIGGVLAFSTDVPSAVLGALAGALLLLVCVVASRALIAGLAGALSSRRGRDVLAIAGALLALALQGIRFLPGQLGGVSDAALDRASSIGRWTPPGALGQAVVDAGAGRTGAAVAGLAYGAVTAAALLWVWGRALERARTTGITGSAAGPRRRRNATTASSATGPVGLLARPPLPAAPWAAVTARELRYLRREPRRQLQFLVSLGLGIGGPIAIAFAGGGDLDPGTVLLASAVGYIALLNAGNAFGLDGAALWMDAAAGVPTRALLVGKNAALAISSAPPVLVAGLVLAAISGGWAYLPVALVVATAGLGAGLAVANWSAVHTPLPLPEGGSPFASPGAGQGCAKGAVLLLCAFVQGLLLLPVAIGVGVTAVSAPGALAVVAPAAALYGWVVWRIGVTSAAQAAERRLPELLADVHPSAV